MIGMLHGQVDFIDAASAIIEVGGVGYETRMPSADLASMHAGQTVKVYTSLNVSQDAITLYGFSPLFETHVFAITEGQRNWSEVALSLLSTLPPERLAKAVADGDATALAKAPGLGKKGAQKIILELKGSIDLSQIEGASKEVRSAEDAGSEQVVEGLMSLGWRQQDALHAVQTVCESNHINVPLRDDDVPRVLKLALASLDRGR